MVMEAQPKRVANSACTPALSLQATFRVQKFYRSYAMEVTSIKDAAPCSRCLMPYAPQEHLDPLRSATTSSQDGVRTPEVPGGTYLLDELPTALWSLQHLETRDITTLAEHLRSQRIAPAEVQRERPVASMRFRWTIAHAVKSMLNSRKNWRYSGRNHLWPRCSSTECTCRMNSAGSFTNSCLTDCRARPSQQPELTWYGREPNMTNSAGVTQALLHQTPTGLLEAVSKLSSLPLVHRFKSVVTPCSFTQWHIGWRNRTQRIHSYKSTQSNNTEEQSHKTLAQWAQRGLTHLSSGTQAARNRSHLPPAKPHRGSLPAVRRLTLLHKKAGWRTPPAFSAQGPLFFT